MGVTRGRTTSAFSDEDSSFYLWKWFTRQRKLKRFMKRKRKTRKARRFDFGDEQMWYLNFMTRKVGGAYFRSPPGWYAKRAPSEVHERRNIYHLFSGERMQLLRNLFPKLRRIRRLRRRRRDQLKRVNLGVVEQLHSDVSNML